MEVAGDGKRFVAAGLGQQSAGLVNEMKRRLVMRAEYRINAQSRRQFPDGAIVVAGDEEHLGRRKLTARSSEFFKHSVGATASSMKKIAKNQQSPSLRCRHEHGQPREILLRWPLRHRDPLVAKRGGLAEMEIGDKKRGRRRKECRSSGEEHDVSIRGRSSRSSGNGKKTHGTRHADLKTRLCAVL